MSIGDTTIQDWRSSVFSPTPTFSRDGNGISSQGCGTTNDHRDPFRYHHPPRNWQPLIVTLILVAGVGISAIVWVTA